MKRWFAFGRESAVLPRSESTLAIARALVALAAITASAAIAVPRDAYAVRFALGVAGDFTPVVVDPGLLQGESNPILIGFRPVLDIELNHYLSFGAFPPFTIYRSSANSTGAESVFGLGASLRKPFLRDNAPEEILAYATIRGGFGTVNGRAGPFYGGALGVSATWLDTGRGFFGEIGVSKLHVGFSNQNFDVDRTMFGVSFGILFHLGGEDWRIGRTRIEDDDEE